jgi:GTP-binding protein
VATHPLQLTFVQSASKTGQLPPTPCEVAFVGRSNVGKSSVINALANRKQLARVSNTPGRTQLLNMFVLPTGATVMDLPGYGFAKVHASARNSWGPMIEGYITGRENLEMVVVLVDGLIGPTALDVQMLEWLRFSEVNHMIVATKHDKVKPSKIGARKAELAAGCNLEINDVLWVSAAKNLNIEVLRNRVLDLLKYTPSDKQQPVRIPASAPRSTTPVARAPRTGPRASNNSNTSTGSTGPRDQGASAPQNAARARTPDTTATRSQGTGRTARALRTPGISRTSGTARGPGITRGADAAPTAGTPRVAGTPRPKRAPQREKTQEHLDELNDFG